MAEIEMLLLSCVKIWDACFQSESSVFSVRAEWITEMPFMLSLCLYCYVMG